MNGIIIVDKPAGLTSHDVVLKLRKWLKIKKVGHTGTLDPLATGVLLITVGWATRLFPYLSGLDKTYAGEIKLGQATDTYDAQGKAVGLAVNNFPDEETLRKAMLSFEGEITQLPPPFSAKKINGEAAFKLARQGKKPKLKPIRVRVYRFLLLDYQPPVVNFLVECSSGTYVRTMAHDLGQILGCGAHLSKLRRLAVGTYTEEEAFTLDKIKELVDSGQKESFIIPMEYLLNEHQAVYLDERGQKMFLQGQKFSLESVVKAISGRGTVKHPEICRVFSREGKLLGLARFEPEARIFQPKLVFKANS